MFPVGRCGGGEREGFGAVNCDVFCAMRLDTKKGKKFCGMACQVLLRLVSGWSGRLGPGGLIAAW
jgi:hypothetical protein